MLPSNEACMRLLIITQAVDLDDPVLGFFHRWIVEFSKHCERIEVICLKEGRHELPSNVSVHSLGKESGRSRLKYTWNFYRYIWTLRKEYDSVFVHMNQEYVLLGWKLWWLLGKRIVLWRNHKTGTVLTRFAALVSDKVCYTSPAAYIVHYKNAVQMPIGIDTGFFSPAAEPPAPDAILFLGRLDPVKRVEVFVQALEKLRAAGISFTADIVGDPTDPRSEYAHEVRNIAASLALEGVIKMHPSVTNTKARDLFRSHAIYVNLTPSGSFDKTIGEAMACGCLVVCANDALRPIISEYITEDTSDSVAKVLARSLSLESETRAVILRSNRDYVLRQHSLELLVQKLLPLLA